MIIAEDLEWIVFDVDGVLIDVSESYDEAVRKTVAHLLEKDLVYHELSLGSIRKLRKKGVFEDDYKLSEALTIGKSNEESFHDFVERFPRGKGIDWVKDSYGTLASEKEIREVFDTYYFGEEEEDGLWKKETPLVEAELLERLEESEDYQIGVVTGRDEKEMQMAESILDFDFDNRVTREVITKPDARALKVIAGDDSGVYLGDSLVDRMLVKNYDDIGGDFEFMMVGEDIKDVSLFLESIINSQ